ncbi:hypothetical protein R51_37530 [Bacillus safensis]|uniref:hypothetical protein n=1 Tax=Bacillus safensis TaxID=561879 RepID=UPI0023E99988|nr:hypothetical protein [Bacillus safensis]GLF88707.1 hypothetical protein R51_37530 [Bacillus safensis]GLF89246.1 hypothetical protein Saga11_05050 [Bacillus safensis]
MEQFERSLEHYSHLKQELIKTAQKLNSCDSEEKEMYQEIALCYSKHLKKMNKLLEEKYGLNLCSIET